MISSYRIASDGPHRQQRSVSYPVQQAMTVAAADIGDLHSLYAENAAVAWDYTGFDLFPADSLSSMSEASSEADSLHDTSAEAAPPTATLQSGPA